MKILEKMRLHSDTPERQIARLYLDTDDIQEKSMLAFYLGWILASKNFTEKDYQKIVDDLEPGFIFSDQVRTDFDKLSYGLIGGKVGGGAFKVDFSLVQSSIQLFLSRAYFRILDEEPKKGIEALEAALATNLHYFGLNNPKSINLYSELAQEYYWVGDLYKAMEYLKKALDIAERNSIEDTPNAAICSSNLANVFYQLNTKNGWLLNISKDNAIQLAQNAAHRLEKAFGEKHHFTQYALDFIAHLKEEFNQESKDTNDTK